MERNFHRRWWLTSPVHQGDHGGAVKTIALGMPFVSGGPCECACVFSFIAREDAGASSIRHSLRPLCFEGARISCKARARGVARSLLAALNCINTFAVVPASAPGPITTNARVVRCWGGSSTDNYRRWLWVAGGACHREARSADPVAGTTNSLVLLRLFRQALEAVLHFLHLLAKVVA